MANSSRAGVHTCALRPLVLVLLSLLALACAPPAIAPSATDAGMPRLDHDAGAAHTCAIRASGEVACWGENATMQLGDGTREWSGRPVAVRGL